jgi:hypothetical protein
MGKSYRAGSSVGSHKVRTQTITAWGSLLLQVKSFLAIVVLQVTITSTLVARATSLRYSPCISSIHHHRHHLGLLLQADETSLIVKIPGTALLLSLSSTAAMQTRRVFQLQVQPKMSR